MIPADATILVNSVQKDHVLERFWSIRRLIIPQLAKLGIGLMTVPNFSFFDDAPRTHTIYNLSRMMRVTEELSEAGIPVAPHLNALTSEDWRYWTEFLKRHVNVGCVTKEFQTGLRIKANEQAAADSLCRLQDDIGRDLHPIIVGGTRLARQMRRAFRSITFTDQTPFSKTKKFQRGSFDGKTLRWKTEVHREGAPLDDLLDDNQRLYEKEIARRCG